MAAAAKGFFSMAEHPVRGEAPPGPGVRGLRVHPDPGYPVQDIGTLPAR